MNVDVTGTLSRVDKDTDTLSMTGTLSDPVIPTPPQRTAADFGLVVGHTYSVITPNANANFQFVLESANDVSLVGHSPGSASGTLVYSWAGIIYLGG